MTIFKFGWAKYFWVLNLLWLVACGDGVATNQPAASTTPGTTMSSNSTVQPDSLYKQVINATKTAQSFKYEATSATTGTRKESGVFVAPNRYSATLESNGQTSYLIVVGDAYYVSADRNSWKKVSTNPSFAKPTSITSYPNQLTSDLSLKVLPDQTADQGQLLLESLTSKGFTQTFQYDKQTLRLTSLTVAFNQNGKAQTASQVHLFDYDKPDNTVTEPTSFTTEMASPAPTK